MCLLSNNCPNEDVVGNWKNFFGGKSKSGNHKVNWIHVVEEQVPKQ